MRISKNQKKIGENGKWAFFVDEKKILLGDIDSVKNLSFELDKQKVLPLFPFIFLW